jgi:hypothetical protein
MLYIFLLFFCLVFNFAQEVHFHGARGVGGAAPPCDPAPDAGEQANHETSLCMVVLLGLLHP